MFAKAASFSSTLYLATHVASDFWTSSLIFGRYRRISLAICSAAFAINTSCAAGRMTTFAKPILREQR
jgi:hypothetical protein